MVAKQLENLFRPFFRGPSLLQTTVASGAQQFAGRTVLASGSASVTVSTAVVNSDSMFRLASVPASCGVAHNSGGNVVVNSIVSGRSFSLARATGVAVPWDETISWEIVKTSMN